MKKSSFAAVVAFAVSLLLGTALAAPALAHTALKSSDPKKNARVEMIGKVTLEFTESVRFPAVLVRGADGKRYESGRPEVDGATVTQGVADSVPPGAYTIAWRVVSDDGHPVEGEIPFTVVAPKAPAAAATASASPATGTPGAVASAPQVTPRATGAAAFAPQSSPAAVQDAQGSAGVPAWVWVVVFGLAGVGIGMLFSLRKKP